MEVSERSINYSRAETLWRLRYKGSDRESEQAMRALEEIQRKFRGRPQDNALPSRQFGARPRAQARVREDEAPRGGGGASVPVDRTVVDLKAHEVRIYDSTGAEIDRWIEWDEVRWRDVNGNEWTEFMAPTTRTESITPAP